jgi:hypothetical protein
MLRSAKQVQKEKEALWAKARGGVGRIQEISESMQTNESTIPIQTTGDVKVQPETLLGHAKDHQK